MKKNLILLPVLLLFFSACATSTLQTANTVPKGKTSFFFASSFLVIKDTTVNVPFPEIGMRHGLISNLDFGIRLFGLGFMGDLKYALIQNRKQGGSLAVQGGIGYFQISELKALALDIGAIFSIKLGSAITPYISAKFRSFGFEVTGDSDFNIFSGEFIVGTVGIELFSQSPISLLIEFSRFYDTDGNANKHLSLVAGGLKFNF